MNSLFGDITVMVVFSALLAWLGALSRQPIIIAYVVAGMVAGPWGLELVSHVELIDGLSRVGITLLLFLAGIVLHPDRLVKLLGKTLLITLVNSLAAVAIVSDVLAGLGMPWTTALVVGVALMFSSTILVVRLLPTTTLHQRHMGAFCIAILIAQDILAVLVIMFLAQPQATGELSHWLLLLAKVAALVAGLLAVERYGLRLMMRRCDTYHEVLYMLTMAWCLGIAGLAHLLGLSHEIGAFIAGVVLARNPIARFISDRLVPLRDFFLMFFFFVLGTRFNFLMAGNILLPAILLTVAIVVSRPLILMGLFRLVGEPADFARRAGLRLGQASEFGLIIAIVAGQSRRVPAEAAQLIQLVVILTMIVSSYVVVFTCPTPLGTRKRTPPGLMRTPDTGHNVRYHAGFDAQLERLARRVARHIEAFLPRAFAPETIARFADVASSSLPPRGFDCMVAEPVWDLLDRNGKCWRPIFTILLLEALGCPTAPYEELISVAELCHTGTLIIDDIQDDAAMRRGDTSIHLRYGTGTAINAANLLYFLPWLRVDLDAHLNDAQKREIFSIMTRQFVRAHLGQTQDLFWSQEVRARRLDAVVHGAPLEEQVLQMYALKTGALIEGLAETAAVIARAETPTHTACAELARLTGVAFQIADDIIDYDTTNSGRKDYGADLREGKITFVLARALARLPTREAARLRRIVSSDELRTAPAAREEAIALVSDNGILETCRQDAIAMIQPPWTRLAPMLVPGEARNTLQQLTHRLLQRRLGAA